MTREQQAPGLRVNVEGEEGTCTSYSEVKNPALFASFTRSSFEMASCQRGTQGLSGA